MAEQNTMEFWNTLRAQIREDNRELIKQAEENITQKISSNLDEKFICVEQELNKIKNNQIEQEHRLDSFDKTLRQRNIIIFGISDNEKKYSELEDLILQIMLKKLEIKLERKEIEFAGRIGKKENNKLRPIRLTLTTLGMKIQILQRKKLLDGSGIYIKEDYPPKVLETRKALQLQLQEQRQNGVSAFLMYDKIVINEKPNNKRTLSDSPQEKETNTKNYPEQLSKKTRTSSFVSKTRTSKPVHGSSSQSITTYITRTPQGNKK